MTEKLFLSCPSKQRLHDSLHRWAAPPLAVAMERQRFTESSASANVASTLTLKERAELQTSSGVKKHHHKHSLKRRYEVLETLGKGTYGKVKRAVARQCGKTVSNMNGFSISSWQFFSVLIVSNEFTCHKMLIWNICIFWCLYRKQRMSL